MSLTTTHIRIIKAARCPSLSGRSSLVYNVGCDENENIYLRVRDNSGGGMFSKDWTPFQAIEQILKARNTVNAVSMGELFKGRSINSAGFLLAVLKDLGLIQATPENIRIYQSKSPEAFLAQMTQLVQSDASLSEDEALMVNRQPRRGTLKLKSQTAPEPSA